LAGFTRVTPLEPLDNPQNEGLRRHDLQDLVAMANDENLATFNNPEAEKHASSVH
jgi:hypothetical protein